MIGLLRCIHLNKIQQKQENVLTEASRRALDIKETYCVDWQ